MSKKEIKVYCNDCEYQRYETRGLCESSLCWCRVFDERIDEWWGVRLKGKIRCKKQNKHNDCQLFSHQ